MLDQRHMKGEAGVWTRLVKGESPPGPGSRPVIKGRQSACAATPKLSDASMGVLAGATPSGSKHS